MKIENQQSITNTLFKAGFCKKIWDNKKRSTYIEEAEKLRDLHNKTWVGQRKETLKKAMDIGYEVGIAVAKDCKRNFLGFDFDPYHHHTWSEEELDDSIKNIREKYNYVLDPEDKKLLVDYALDIVNTKEYIKQGFSNEEIANKIRLSVNDVRTIRYYEITASVDFKEQVVVEVRLEEYIKLVLKNEFNLTKKRLSSVTSPFLTQENIEDLKKLKMVPDSKDAITRYAEDLMLDWLQPLYLEEYDCVEQYDCDTNLIDMEKVEIVRKTVRKWWT